MNEEVEKYLSKIHENLHLDPSTEKVIIKEIYNHLAEKIIDKKRREKASQNTIHNAIEEFGNPKDVARLMYEAHSQKKWHEVILCGEAHLFVSFLFLFHLWSNPLVLGIMLLLSVFITLYGLKNEISEWAYSWCGFLIAGSGIGIFLIRRTAAEIILHFIPAKISTIPLYAAVFIAVSFFILFLVFFAVRRVLRQDWISVSYMLMPVPLLSVWISFIDKQAAFSGWGSSQLFTFDRVMAVCFIVMAAASVFFVRIRLRFYKFLYITTASAAGAIITAHSVWANISLSSIVLISAFAVTFLLIPALFYRFSFHNISMDREWLKNAVKDSMPLRWRI